MNSNLTEKKLGELFQVKSGDFHSTSELDTGNTALISCGETNNGLVGFEHKVLKLEHKANRRLIVGLRF